MEVSYLHSFGDLTSAHGRVTAVAVPSEVCEGPSVPYFSLAPGTLLAVCGIPWLVDSVLCLHIVVPLYVPVSLCGTSHTGSGAHPVLAWFHLSSTKCIFTDSIYK